MSVHTLTKQLIYLQVDDWLTYRQCLVILPTEFIFSQYIVTFVAYA